MKKQLEQADNTKFINEINSKFDLNIHTFQDSHKWSIEKPESFWDELWSFTNAIGDKGQSFSKIKTKCQT